MYLTMKNSFSLHVKIFKKNFFNRFIKLNNLWHRLFDLIYKYDNI